jgi:aromatic ring-opening dioxygenase catalytic subunit (LigB family)
MYPQAQIPVVSLSLRADLSPSDHIRMGAALEPLRDEGVLIVGSGLTYHNLRMLRQAAHAGPVSDQFEAWLTSAVSERDVAERARRLEHWAEAPAARLAHPREEHLIPLMVVAGAAGQSPGKLDFQDRVWGVSMASYRFEDAPRAKEPLIDWRPPRKQPQTPQRFTADGHVPMAFVIWRRRRERAHIALPKPLTNRRFS